MVFIVDEWLWHDLAGENGEIKREESAKFLYCVFGICDKLSVMVGSPFVHKFWKFSKKGKIEPKLVKLFKLSFLSNSQKCLIHECTSKHRLKGIKEDDLYLYNLWVLHKEDDTEDDIIVVTTDSPLLEIFSREGVKVVIRDEFVREYVSRCKRGKDKRLFNSNASRS